MSELNYPLTTVNDKPNRRSRKGSKYDPILDAFLEQDHPLVQVTVAGREANYVRTQLNKRIETRNLENIKVSVINNIVYLEKV